MKKVLLAGIGIVGIYALTTVVSLKSTADKLISEILRVKYLGFKTGIATFKLVTEHTNPSTNNLLLDYAFIDLFIGDKKIASIKEDLKSKLDLFKGNATEQNKIREQHTIKSEQTSQIDLFATASILDVALAMGGTVLEFIRTQKLPNTITAKGYMSVNGIRTQYIKEIPLG